MFVIRIHPYGAYYEICRADGWGDHSSLTVVGTAPSFDEALQNAANIAGQPLHIKLAALA